MFIPDKKLWRLKLFNQVRMSTIEHILNALTPQGVQLLDGLLEKCA